MGAKTVILASQESSTGAGGESLRALLMAFLILTSGVQAGQMITPNNPVAFHFDRQEIAEDGNLTVYISDCMMPNPEPGITFVPVNEGRKCGGAE